MFKLEVCLSTELAVAFAGIGLRHPFVRQPVRQPVFGPVVGLGLALDQNSIPAALRGDH